MSGLLRSIALALLCLPATYALAQNCTINAGVTTSVCPNNKFILAGSSSGLIAVNPVWTQVGGPAVTIKNPGSLTSEILGYTPGNTYKFRLSAKCVDGSLIFDEVIYNTYPATIANAGADISVCPPGGTLQANAAGTGESGIWTLDGSPQGITMISSPTNPVLNIKTDADKAGTATFHWTITSNNSCRSSDDIVVTYPGGVMPVTAGADQVLGNCYTTTQSAVMNASFGGTNINGQQGTWSVLSGPTVPVFSNIHDHKATVSNLTTGTYKLRWTVQGPCANGTADVTLTVPVGTQSVTVARDAEATYCDGRTSTIITGLTPAYAGETITWTNVSGAGTIVSPNSPSTEVKNLNGQNSAFRYTISNPNTGCNTSGVYTVKYTVPPTITAPSPVVAPCNASFVTVNYSYTGGDKTQWSLISAPAGVPTTGFADAAYPLLLPQYTIPGTYLVRLRRTTNNGSGGCQDQYADVYVQISQSPTAANAGTRQVLACSITETHLAGNTPAIGTGSWSQVSGPGIAQIADRKDPTTLISQLLNGTYTFRWIITGNMGCPNQQADVQVVVSDRNPTAAAAGQDQTICNSTPYKLQGNKPGVNENGLWSATPATGVIFSDPADPLATVTGMAPNTAYTFTWTVKNSCGQNSANVHITTSAVAGPKQAVAGPDKCLPAGTTALTLAGNTPANGESGKWTVIGSSNGLTFTDDTQPNTGVTGAGNGTYQLEWSLSRNGCPATRDTVLYTIATPATTANAGTNQRLCGSPSITLQGNDPAVGTGKWSQQQGPGGITIVNPSQYNTSVNNLSDGRYIFRWTISNGACDVNYSEVTYTITTPPSDPNAGPDQVVCDGAMATLNANTITNGIGTWSVLSGPSNPQFDNPSDPKTTISKLKTGTYKLQWAASSGPDCALKTDEVILTVKESAKIQTTTQQLCNATTAMITGNEGSTGTWSQTGGPAGPTIKPNASNAAVITNMTPGNTYKFTYTIAADAGCNSTSAEATIITSALPSTAAAGPDQQFCLPKTTSSISTTLQATTPSYGTGIWTVDSKPDGATDPVIQNTALPNTAVDNLLPGIYVFKWTVSNGYCTSNSDIMRIVVSAEPSDPQPGADQNNACINNIQLNAITPTSGIGTWSFETVPAGNTAVIEGINAPSTKVLGTIVGQYAFRWTISSGVCPSKSALVNVKVTSVPPNPADANVGKTVPDAHCILSGTSTAITLHANAPQAGETGKWTIEKADGSPAPFTFTADDPQTTVSNVTAGEYLLRWTINSGSCASTSEFPVKVYDKPSPANAGVTQNICLYSPLTLNAQAPAIGTGIWSVISSAAGTPVFDVPNNPASGVNGLAPGTYTFRWTTTNGVCPASSADVQVNVDDCGIKVTKAATQPTQNSDGSYNIQFTFTLHNPATAVTINNVQVTDYIPASLPPAATYTVTSHSLTGINGYNNAFDGKTDINLLQPGQASLAPGATASITLTINVKFF
ncbi:hypothetical protein [Chitinophaga sp. HK235]|uniref:hypothetical protein n=1 Tax=Chitinophaga sp. HK235 TaxID=2952571 RepID=UPI001BA656F7|nr:hypothetical protein [Chitinophaga sp. HK235]